MEKSFLFVSTLWGTKCLIYNTGMTGNATLEPVDSGKSSQGIVVNHQQEEHELPIARYFGTSQHSRSFYITRKIALSRKR